jgi:hypothetical protein
MELNETDKIRDLELERRAAGKTLELVSGQIHALARLAERTVEEEWETGKDKALSNAQKRAAEVEARLALDEGYRNLQTEYKELTERKELLRIDIDYLLREEQRRLCDVLERQLSVVCLTGAV